MDNTEQIVKAGASLGTAGKKGCHIYGTCPGAGKYLGLPTLPVPLLARDISATS